LFKFPNISQDTSAFPWAKRTPYAGLPAVATVALALLLGFFTGHESAGAIAAGAAYSVGFAVFHETLASRLLSMGLLTLGIASATLAGSLAADWTLAVLLVTVIAAINYGLLAGISPTAGWIGQQCAIYVIVASYFPLGVHFAVGRTAMVVLGGALQMLTYALTDLFQNRHAQPPAEPLSARFPARLHELWLKLRNETRLTGETAIYTLRMAITLLLCTAIYRHFHVRNGYWSPMTALLVLKPQWSATLSRGIARFIGTLAGAGVALLLAHTLPIDTAVVFAMVVLCAWACYALQAVNYALFSLVTTLYIVFLFRFGGFSQAHAAHIRLLNTAIGGGIALTIDVVWKLCTRKLADESGSIHQASHPLVNRRPPEHVGGAANNRPCNAPEDNRKSAPDILAKVAKEIIRRGAKNGNTNDRTSSKADSQPAER